MVVLQDMWIRFHSCFLLNDCVHETHTLLLILYSLGDRLGTCKGTYGSPLGSIVAISL